MRRACAGIYAGLRDGRLRAEFDLTGDGPMPPIEATRYVFQHAEPASIEADRVTLGRIGSQTFV